MKLGRTTPILRIFDVARAREFCLGFLGFSVDSEHRFSENHPLYLQICDPFGNRLTFTGRRA